MGTAIDPNERSTQSFNSDFGRVSRVSVQSFVDHYLPAFPADMNFTNLMRGLRRRRRLWRQLVTKDERLWGYSKHAPSQMDPSRAYAHLPTCFTKLATSVPRRNRSLSFSNNTRSSWWHAVGAEPKALPDAYIMYSRDQDGDTPAQWSNIAVSGVYCEQSRGAAWKLNAARLSHCMANCIMEDPTRRFTYGFAIEDTQMSLWYCDRSGFVASEFFDFVSNYPIMFRFFMSCAFAEPHALGFDPTMTPVLSLGGQVQYDIAVHSPDHGQDVYRTSDLLFDAGSRYVLGRATRVWKATKVDPTTGALVGPPVVLKDAWVDSHREREGKIDARIRQAASCLPESDRARLNEVLLTVLCHGDVTVAGRPDRTRFDSTSTQATQRASPDDAGRDHPATPATSQTHYRIVVQEVCTPLHEVPSLSTIFEALADACEGLSLIHRCGWVHGDISINNILLCGGTVKISDFEYAKQFKEIGEHDRIGTSFFMPVEVKYHRYWFNFKYWGEPSSPCAVTPESDTDPDDPFLNARRGPPGIKTQKKRLPGTPIIDKERDMKYEKWSLLDDRTFRYNPLHDAEGLWWIATYFLMTRTIAVNPEALDEESRQARISQIEKQRSAAKGLFTDRSKRQAALVTQSAFKRELYSLHRSMRKASSAVEDARDAIVRAYHHVEQDIESREFSVQQDMYDEVKEQFAYASRRTRKLETETVEFW